MKEIASVTPSWAGLTYDGLRRHNFGLQYPVLTPDSDGTAFLFEDKFPTPDGRALFVPVEFLPPNELPDAEVSLRDGHRPADVPLAHRHHDPPLDGPGLS